MMSVIIPTYNEERALHYREGYFQELSKHCDLIFSDGGSQDATACYAKRWGRLVIAPKGRASQMNAGAQFARHETLLFLHADTRIPIENLQCVERTLEKGYVGGCFSQVIESSEWIFRWIAWTGDVRARMSKIFYGDQGIFVSKKIFNEIGGFPVVKLGEDILFSRQLRSKGKTVVLSAPIYCSARRWRAQGLMKTFFLNLQINWALIRGYNIEKLAKLYTDIRGE